MNKKPPKIASRFLEWFCPTELFEGIEGDLLEKFEFEKKEVGEKRARRRFVWNTINFFRPSILLRNRFTIQSMNNIMIGNYFKVASRNILKRKLYSFINAFGLSIGIAFCILIFLFIQDERSFDQFHVNKNNIYRLEGSYDRVHKSAYLPLLIMQASKDELPEVIYATRFNSGVTGIVRSGDKVFSEKKIAYVDVDFFNMFSFPLIAGNRKRLFANQSEVVITPAIAKKYFGDQDPLGKTLQIDDDGNKEFIVAGVIETPPANSSLEFDILLPQSTRPYYQQMTDEWWNFNTPTFVQLMPNTDMKKFSLNLNKVMQTIWGRWLENSTVPTPPGLKMFELGFTQLPDWHLKKEINWDKVSDPQYSLILGGIAALILLIASINYISLALTTSASRKIEVGIRKVAGAQKQQLVWQFSIESIVFSLMSMIIGIGLVFLFLPSFNQFTDKGIAISLSTIVPVLLASLALTIFIGAFAGSYPAFFLSSFRPASVLKGVFTSKVNAGFTKPLVVIQFVLSAFLIMSSVIMYRQMKYVTTIDLGYNKEQVLVIPTQTGYSIEGNKMVERFRARLQQEPSIISVAGTAISFSRGFMRLGYKIKGEEKAAYVYSVDAYYLPTLEATLVQGRNFDARIAADSNAIIVNEALVRNMKWTDPLNEYINASDQEDPTNLGAKVIGVVKDYHFLSLEKNIEPMFLSMNKKFYLTTMLIKITPGNIPDKLETIRKTWRELAPDKPFEYSFLDEDVAKQYQSYQRWMSIMGLATGFAILISCLGLFGLSGINALNRTKEMGIRKVMGADVTNIFILLNREFVWLALIAFVFAAPLSWYVMNQWLKDFQFKIAMRWEVFAMSMISGLMVALITVSYHAIKTASVNPAETLKYE